ncbi:LysR family transcriptional regulator of beta-lactamase [Mesorhizobium soli]|uniref:LysR family transcriptional regulator n=1 Tax=Pseudaminobacter soli (ex Li et al. 2025) TaxID=1295366 RepID=UPI00247467CC|nr:LysR family transcriptional regulator [Mesorhizobium soli]MDH6232530.1 LysR family transcriptional regulator of beta-lactamase [Mesorhizobium soli]
MPPLGWLRSFEAAARLSNFTGAATELGLTQAAISQHIRSLEEHLKTRLFIRRARGIDLTPEGAAYLPHIQSAFATIGNSTTELFEPRATQTVTIRSPISFATLMLAPLLPQLSKSHPFIRLQIETIHKPADYGDAWNGLDIRFGNGAFAGRRADQLTSEALQPMAAPWLAGDPGWPRLPLLTVFGARGMWGEWFSAAGVTPPAEASHKFDTFVTALEAAVHGAGVLLGSRPLADAALRERALLPLSDYALRSGTGHYLTAPSGTSLDQAEETVRLWLLAAFRRYLDIEPVR